ncbi:hypothetical protein COX97_04235 [Candidatus Pacearchaeota archaeon CG_4_10_14_0_2_um_filter_05_32_18]|nr:MAG: hypothetical protein COX97_04235 [Candidatus Pacearchaeota archaeon CG_4_10_14_0_2_um_filter_05_32_18]
MAENKSSYLVCRNNINDVKKFLKKFFKEVKGKYNHPGWITFKINPKFIVNLMEGNDQIMTQNMTFEICCKSLKELEKFAKKFNCKIDSFVATETVYKYRYHYIEIFGPANICKIEINYTGKP